MTGGIFKWKSESKWSFDLVCVDEREVVVARFESGSWAVSKLGMIELAQGVDGGLLEEIIVSGVAMIQLVKMTKNMTMGGIAGGAGGG